MHKQPRLEERWVGDYEGLKDRAIAATLDDRELMEAFQTGTQLPRGFGFAVDERIAEIPWAVANLPAGRVLDAGSALNHEVILARLSQRAGSLTITTFTAEEEHPHPGLEYVTADLRDLPFADAAFDAVVSISTLEHVGMDNSEYGSDEPASPEPDGELDRALSELRRVLRPGGRLLITLPYGQAENHGWLRQFDAAGIERIRAVLGEGSSEVRVYGHGFRGWQLSEPRRASQARFHDPRGRTGPDPDCTFAAGAVACIALDLPL
jgi:SAM-dependent methyltransferase